MEHLLNEVNAWDEMVMIMIDVLWIDVFVHMVG